MTESERVWVSNMPNKFKHLRVALFERLLKELGIENMNTSFVGYQTEGWLHVGLRLLD